MAFDFVTTLLLRREIEGEELAVCHVAAPEQKAAQVPVLLRPDRLESEINGKNIAMRLKIQWVVEQREPDVRAGETLTAMSNKCVPLVSTSLFASDGWLHCAGNRAAIVVAASSMTSWCDCSG